MRGRPFSSWSIRTRTNISSWMSTTLTLIPPPPEQDQFKHPIRIGMEQKASKLQKEFYDRRRVEAPSLKEGVEMVYPRRRTKGQKKHRNANQNAKMFNKARSFTAWTFRILRKLENNNYESALPTRMRLHPIFHIIYFISFNCFNQRKKQKRRTISKLKSKK